MIIKINQLESIQVYPDRFGMGIDEPENEETSSLICGYCNEPLEEYRREKGVCALCEKALNNLERTGV